MNQTPEAERALSVDKESAFYGWAQKRGIAGQAYKALRDAFMDGYDNGQAARAIPQAAAEPVGYLTSNGEHYWPAGKVSHENAIAAGMQPVCRAAPDRAPSTDSVTTDAMYEALFNFAIKVATTDPHSPSSLAGLVAEANKTMEHYPLIAIGETDSATERNAARYKCWRDGMLAADLVFVEKMQDALPQCVGSDRAPTADEWDAALDAICSPAIAAMKGEAVVASATELDTALQPIYDAVTVNEGDTMAALLPDDHVVWTASGSWGPSASVTLGDMRRLAELHSGRKDERRLGAEMKGEA